VVRAGSRGVLSALAMAQLGHARRGFRDRLLPRALAWIGQFVGHAVEGKRPSFFKDLQFLLIGPLWLLAAAYRRFSLPY